MGLGSHVNGRSTDRGPYPCQTGELTYKKKRDHLGGRRGHCQVFASGQLFCFYRRVLTVTLCEVWFVCYIAISSTKINLFEHCCSSHNRGLAFVISRRRLEGAGPGEHAVAHFKTTKKTYQSKYLISKTKQIEIFLSQEESETILGQKWYEKVMFLWKIFKKLRWKQKIIIYSFENFHLFISNICMDF